MTAPMLAPAIRRLDESARATVLRHYPVTRDDMLLAEIIDSVVLTHGDAASVVTADWYGANRAANGIRGSYTAEALTTPKSGAHSLVGWAGNTATTEAAMQELVLGGVTKRIYNAMRQTINDNTVADPRADGWQRSARAGACLFCAMLADRGHVYTKATSDFSSHDHCRCQAVPAWAGRPRPVKATYTPGARRERILNNPKLTDAERAAQLETLARDAARAREWMAMNAKALAT